jgi:hypothetical protein
MSWIFTADPVYFHRTMQNSDGGGLRVHAHILSCEDEWETEERETNKNAPPFSPALSSIQWKRGRNRGA